MQKKFRPRRLTQQVQQHKTTFKQPFMFSKFLVSFVLVMAIGFISYQIIGIWTKKHRIEIQKQEFLSQISRLRFENKELEKIKQYLASSNYQEKEIKNKLDLKKPGETAVIVPESILPDNLSNEDLVRILKEDVKDYLPKAKTNPEKWWSFFFDKNKL